MNDSAPNKGENETSPLGTRGPTENFKMWSGVGEKLILVVTAKKSCRQKINRGIRLFPPGGSETMRIKTFYNFSLNDQAGGTLPKNKTTM